MVVSFLLGATPNFGHVTGVLDVGRQLAARGHRVRMLTGSGHLDRVRSAGLEALRLPPGADVDMDDPNAAFPERRGLSGIAGIRFDMLHLFVEPVPAQVAALDNAIAAEPTDVVMVDPTFAGAAILLSRPSAPRPVVACLGILPLMVPGPGLAPVGMGRPPRHGFVGTVRNRTLHSIAGRMFAPVDARWREIQTGLGVETVIGTAFEWPTLADAIIQLTVANFEYPRPDLASVYFAGSVGSATTSRVAPPHWWSDLDDGRPVVHVTQGTLANKDLDQLIMPALRGLAGVDAHVVVSLGGRPVTDLTMDLPANARVASYLPYDQLLPRTHVMVTNGGYGGVHHALTHGVPIVAAGRTEDKTEVSARVAWARVGINLSTDRPTPRAVRRAVQRALADHTLAANARAMAARLAAAPGIAGIEQQLTDLLTRNRRRPRP